MPAAIGMPRRCAVGARIRSSACRARASSARARPSWPASCCGRSRSSTTSPASDDRGRQAAVQRHRRSSWTSGDAPLGWTLQLHLEPHDGQPVGPDQHVCAGASSGGAPQNYYDLDAGVRPQQHRHAASGRARPDRPAFPGPPTSVTSMVWLLGGWSASAIDRIRERSSRSRRT